MGAWQAAVPRAESDIGRGRRCKGTNLWRNIYKAQEINITFFPIQLDSKSLVVGPELILPMNGMIIFPSESSGVG